MQNPSQFLQRFPVPPTRKKLVLAAELLAERLPDEVFNRLPSIVVVAPELSDAAYTTFGGEAMIYFSPEYETRPQTENSFSFAHEMAHIALGHHIPNSVIDTGCSYLERPSEKDADRLTQSWGYNLPAWRQT